MEYLVNIIKVTKFLILATLILISYHPITTKGEPTWANTMPHNNGRKTTFQLYYHDSGSGNSSTAVEVVPAPGSTSPFTGFGYISMANAPLTSGPELTSKLVGRAHGMTSGASAPDEDPAIYMAITFSFTEGIFNGSSLSIMGLNSFLQPVRELPVVGGTGVFRMARGYAMTRTILFNTTSLDVTAEYNFTVFH